MVVKLLNVHWLEVKLQKCLEHIQKINLILAGFAVGVVDKDKLLTKNKIKNNDVVLAVPSSGLHSNGFSLVRAYIK